ncbi:hypothetical protein MBLNU459_g1073t1 [Dothideomycetes sp. NU459]
MSSYTNAGDGQLQCLHDGFDALRLEYYRLWTRCQVLEANVESAKSQYARLTDQCPHKPEPLSLREPPSNVVTPDSDAWMRESGIVDASRRTKISAACLASQKLHTTGRAKQNGVVIHSGPSADRPSAPTSAAMPSISESPLEQDFTVEGTPSKLGCPFASMTNRTLTPHAASVVSRYRPDATATPRSSLSRANGRASSVARSRSSLADPISAETCAALESPRKPPDMEASVQGSNRACPIRFLNQHSPEEVAAYFESHKHELPRSHEVCVKRYQSNEESIRQLDAKYGNLVSMIQGLGQKHQPMLPGKDEVDEDAEDRESAEKIRKWAASVDTDQNEINGTGQRDDMDDEERQPHFDRPLKDVRVGESPSRPWGIQVPIRVDRRKSSGSSVAAPAPATKDIEQTGEVPAGKPRGACPFGFDAGIKPGKPEKAEAELFGAQEESRPAFIQPEASDSKGMQVPSTPARMVFTGPVFIGYTMEQASALLKSHNTSAARRKSDAR